MRGLNKTYRTFLLAVALLLILCYDLVAQGCVSTSTYPWLWPSHRNWFIAPPNLWNGQVINMATGVRTSVGTSGPPAVQQYEGTSCASDDSGNLLFFTNGRRLYKGTGASVTNPYSGLLEGNEGGATGFNGSAVQGVLTVRHPLNPTKYYIFTTDDANGGATLGFNYFVFNPSGTNVAPTGANRLGSYRVCEGIAATKHANGVDIWITCLESGSGKINSYLLTCAGLTTAPVVSTIGPVVSGQQERGGIAFSVDGTRFATGFSTVVNAYVFDNSTGLMSDRHTITGASPSDAPYDIIFSPDGSKIYYTQQNGNLMYINISGWPSAATMISSRTSSGVATLFNSIEFAADGFLYMSTNRNGGPIAKISGNYNAATGFSAANVTGTVAAAGLPSMYLPPQEEPDIHEVGPYCVTDAAVDLSTTWLCSGLNAEDATNYPTEYAGTGITNTGTGIFNPATAGVGTHRIIFTRCSVDDTIWITVNTCSCPDTTLSNIPSTCSSAGTISLNSYKVTTEAGTWSLQSGGSTAAISGSTFNINNTSAGNYVVRFTLSSPSGDCPTYAERTVVIKAKPNVTLTNATICSGDAAATFDAGAGYTTYAWSGNGTGAARTASGIAAGTYTVSVTDANGCKDTASATLTVNTKPNVTLTNATICSGDAAATFDAGAGYTTYAWSANGTGAAQTTSGTAAGTYTVIVTDANGCKDTASATLTGNAKPTITPASATICSGDAAVNFDAGSGYATYAWSGPATASTQTISATVAGTYQVIVTTGSGCMDTATATLTVNSKPNVTLTNATICSGDAAATFDAGAGYTTYAWSANGTGASQNTSGTTAGTYIVRVVDANGCKDTASATLTVNAKPNVTLTNVAICSGDAAATFDAGAGYTTYAWSGNGTGAARTTSGTTAGTYIVMVTDANGCKDTASATLTVNTKPNVTLTNATICSGDAAATFDAGAGYTNYAWSGNGTGSSRTTSGTTAGTYTVMVTDANGCKDTASATLTVNTKPNVTLTNATICSGDAAATFDAGAGYTTYAWSGNGTGAARTTNGTTAGTYTVMVTDANGCKDTASATLTVNTKPNVTLTNVAICSGDAAATFDAGAGYTTYAWSANGTGASQTTSGIAAGTYTVSVTDANGCKDTASATLTVNTKPNVTLTNATICAGDAAVTFDAGAGYTTYAWSGNGTGAAQTTSGTAAGTYTVRVADANGCKDTASATLTVNTKPNVTLTNATICAGDAAATFDAGAGYTTYAWSANGTGAAQTTSGTAAGTYTVIVTDANGCKDTASATLTGNAKPTITPASATICSGDAAVNFDAGSGYATYAWSGPATASTQTISATVAGTYQVIVTTGSGCKDTASATLTVNTKPNVTLTNATICSGDAAATFDAGAGYTSYLWSGNATGTAQATSGTTAGNYIVAVVDANGCKDTASAILVVNALPVVNLGADVEVCYGTAATTFDAGNLGLLYDWSNGANTKSISTTIDGDYIVQVTDLNGCKGRDTVKLTVNPLPVVNLGADRSICLGSTTTFDAGSGFSLYLWENNTMNQTLTVNTAENVSVIVKDANGCTDADTALVTISTNLTVTLGADKAICIGSPAVAFDAGNTGATYLWSDGSSNQTLSTATAGTYWVSVSDENGCAGKDTVALTINPLPVVALTNASICDGSTGAVFTPGAYTTYLWSSGETTPSVTKTAAGTYTVIVSDANACKDSASATLTVNALPVVDLGADRSICPGTSATFDAGSFTSYLWNDNSTAQTRIVSSASTITVEVSDANGCKARDTAEVTVKNSLTVNLGPDKAICLGDAPVTFDAVLPDMNYVWSNSETTQSISTNTAGTYIVIVDDGSGCTGKDTVELVVNALPVVDLGADKAICLGDPMVTFDAGAGYATYGWSNNSAARNIAVDAAGFYAVEVTDNNGCIANDTVELIVNNLPVVDLGADRSICPGMTTTFDAGSFAAYAWNNSSSSQTNAVGAQGNVIVNVADANGCKDSDTASVTISNNLTVLLGDDKGICFGDGAVTFDAGIAGATYSWNSGESTQTISTNVGGSYAVTVTTPEGCTGTDVVTLTVNALPAVTIANQTICAGDTATFNAGNFAAYSWLSGENTASISKSAAGTYRVEVTDAKGCKNTASATLSINSLPIVALNSKAVCAGSSATFDAGVGFGSYVWSSGETSQSISKSAAGTYSVTVKDANNCKASASATLVLNPLPAVTLAPFTPKCLKDAPFAMSGGTPAGGEYKTMYNSAQTLISTFDAKLMGTGSHPIFYEYMDNNGCKNVASSAIVVYNMPILSIDDETVCAGESATFDAGAGFTSYYWNTAVNTRTMSTSTGGDYVVNVTSASGCKASDTVKLIVNANPQVDLGADKKACEGSNFTLASNTIADSYLWNNNATSNSITVNTSGKYSLMVTDVNGCKGSDDVQVNIFARPAVDLGADKQICDGSSVTLNTNLDPTASVYWSIGTKDKSISVNRTGAYMVQAYYDPTCPAFDTINVIVVPMPVSTLGNDTAACFKEIGSLTLDAGTADQFLWNDKAQSTSSAIDVEEEGTYIVQLTNANLCSVKDTININQICVTTLFIPNAFSPNGDASNDVFYVKGLHAEKFHLMIFNRWGEIIFESYDINNGWDGTYMGNEVQIDVYVWKLDWLSTNAQEQKTKNERIGTVSLIR